MVARIHYLLPDEHFFAPYLTNMAKAPDCTSRILQTLKMDESPDSPGGLSLLGDFNFSICFDGKVADQPVARSGDNHYLQKNIIRILNGPPTIDLLINLNAPWFFTKFWQPYDLKPGYTTPETAETNWKRMIHLFNSMMSSSEDEGTMSTSVTFDGSSLFDETEWMVEYVKDWPNLEVEMA